MQKQVKNILLLAAITGTLNMYSCRETKEDEAAPPMQNEMHQEGQADPNANAGRRNAR